MRSAPATLLRASADHHCVAKLQWLSNVVQGCDPFARATNRDRSIAEQSPEDGLVHIHAFNLVHVDLGRMALDQAALGDDAPVCDSDLCSKALEPCRNSKYDSNDPEQNGTVE